MPYAPTGYKEFRDVQVDYHAKGDGTTDDSDAINLAVKEAAGDMQRCGANCSSTTTLGAVIYFPVSSTLYMVLATNAEAM